MTSSAASTLELILVGVPGRILRRWVLGGAILAGPLNHSVSVVSRPNRIQTDSPKICIIVPTHTIFEQLYEVSRAFGTML